MTKLIIVTVQSCCYSDNTVAVRKRLLLMADVVVVSEV